MTAETPQKPEPDKGWTSLWHKHPGVDQNLTRGERAADLIRNGMGSWPFVIVFFVFMFVWIVVNAVFLTGHPFDPYPFILLNLALSMLAAIQAAILLIAAKRADSIASEIAIHTEENTEDLKKIIQENTDLTTQIKNDTALLDEIFNILKRKEGE